MRASTHSAVLEHRADGTKELVRCKTRDEQNHPPKPHLVPKLEDLLEALHPDSSSKPGATSSASFLTPKRCDAGTPHACQKSLPFKDQRAPLPEKIYWVNPPTSDGRVSKEVQDFFSNKPTAARSTGTVIDSRALVTYLQAHGSTRNISWGR